jgi:hypothetical protein
MMPETNGSGVWRFCLRDGKWNFGNLQLAIRSGLKKPVGTPFTSPSPRSTLLKVLPHQANAVLLARQAVDDMSGLDGRQPSGDERLFR